MSTTQNQPFTTGDDIEDAFAIIGENGGVGEWEEATGEDAAGDVPRWLFPRFDGATDPGHMYLSRTGLGPYDTDVETVAAWLSAPRTIVGAILVIGEPGCGKTALIEAAVCHADRELVTHISTPDDTRESLMLRFVGEGNGDCVRRDHVEDVECDEGCDRSPFVLGPLPYAAKYGKVYYGDEFMLTPDGVKPVFYEAADGRAFLSGGNIDGSPLEIHEDFRMVLSSNPLVRGASLPEPISSRCAGTTLTVKTSAGMLHDLSIDESIVNAWEALGTQGLWRPQIREMRVADYWLTIDPAQSVSAFLPEHCPESQREQIRNTVVSFIGGATWNDGRLVVS